jgi:NitT/TauT family transport system substrate-binding protein
MRRLARVVLAGTLGITLAVASACTSSSDSNEPDTDTTFEIVPVTYLTGFGIFGRESYMYVGLDKGWFREAGIDLTIEAGTGNHANVVELLLNDQAQFAIMDMSSAIIGAATTDGPPGYKIISAVHQLSLAAVMTLDPNITTPKDLEGKRFGQQPGSIGTVLFDTYADLAGFDASTVEMVNIPPQNLIQALATDQVDFITQFPMGKGGVERAAGGRPATVFSYSDYITDLYGNVLAVSDALIESNPDLVRRFNEVMLRSLEYSIQNTEEAGEIFAKYQEVQPAPAATGEMNIMAPYVRTTGGEPIGFIDPQRVARAIAVLQSAGAIPSAVNGDDLIDYGFVPSAG